MNILVVYPYKKSSDNRPDDWYKVDSIEKMCSVSIHQMVVMDVLVDIGNYVLILPVLVPHIDGLVQ